VLLERGSFLWGNTGEARGFCVKGATFFLLPSQETEERGGELGAGLIRWPRARGGSGLRGKREREARGSHPRSHLDLGRGEGAGPR
jgi:hypothetical protein